MAGALVGPGAFALVRDQRSIETLAGLGVILLLFSIGLEFSLRRLRRVGGVALVAALLEIPFVLRHASFETQVSSVVSLPEIF